jgi:hypothetical protein
VGFVLVAQTVPLAVLVLVGGVVADRLPRYLNFDFSEFTPVEELNGAVEDSTGDANCYGAGKKGADARPALSRLQTLT